MDNKIIIGLLIQILFLLSCGAPHKEPVPAPLPVSEDADFVSERSETVEYASTDILKRYEEGLNKEYRIGPCDIIEIISPHRPQLVGEHIVSPDGTIAIFLGGEIPLNGLTRKQAEGEIIRLLSPYYESLVVMLKIKTYKNNKVYVLGRVDHPGVISFEGRPTLLEALSVAAPFPPVQQAAFLSRCAIMRGNDQILWVNLQELLRRGNMKLNIQLANNDVIYIPDPQDSNVFIMGEVKSPGSYEIRDVLTLLNAIGLAGGVTEDAVTSEIKLVRDRGRGGGVIEVDLDRMMAEADFSQNYLLKNNDIIFVPRKGVATFNYYLRQIDPFVQLLIVTETLSNNK